MKNTFSFILIAVSLLCSCGTAKMSREYICKKAYDKNRTWYLDFVNDSTNYKNYFLMFGKDEDGFIPVSNLYEPLEFDAKKNNEFVDTLLWLYNSTQLLDMMVYDCSTIERYIDSFDPIPYANALGSIDAGCIRNEELSNAMHAVSQAVYKDISNGASTDTIHYEELEHLHGLMETLFNDFIDSRYTEASYNCNEIIKDYDAIHSKAVSDNTGYHKELLQAVFNEKDFEKQCIYAREFAYANWCNPDTEPVDVVAVIESLLCTTGYSPLLYDLWLIWRTSLQSVVLSGRSNDSSMYNLHYNAMKRRVAYKYIERLEENPNDALAFNRLINLIYKDPIIRNSGCLYGNNCIFDEWEIYQECFEYR